MSGFIKRNFSPTYYYCSIADIDLEELRNQGIKALLIDLDNTIVPWYNYKIPRRIAEWIERAKGMGFKICIVSNGMKFRVRRLSQKLGVQFVARAVKPGLRGLRSAIDKLGVELDEVVLIGDQIFTDIWAGNRLGIKTILVRPLSRWELITTYPLRLLEWGMIKWLKLDMRGR